MPALSYLSPKAMVKASGIHGRGLFARERIGKDEIVCIKGGHIFDRRRLTALPPELGPAEIQITEDLFIGPVRAEERDGGMIVSNHSCEPNIGVQGQIVFVAMRDVEAGEELTHDWATTDDDNYEMACNCGRDLPPRDHGAGLAQAGAAAQVRRLHVVVPAGEDSERAQVEDSVKSA